MGSGATSNGVVVLRTRHFQRSAAILAGLLTLVGITVVDIAAAPVLAVAELPDGTLTVIVNRDVDGNGNYSGDIDQPQPGIEIAVTDASEHRVTGITDRDGRFVLRATNKLKGGRYFVVAKMPPALSELTPVPESSTFQPLSTTVDVTSDNQTVRFGVALGRPVSQPTPPEATGTSRGSDRPGLAQFAVGDLVWRDDNRSGVQDPGESPAAQVSVQLLNVAGEVVASTVSDPSGRYIFDHLPAGTYSVRFAGVPEEFRMTPAAVSDQPMIDSDPDYSGVTPPFTLGVGELNVRPTTTADGVTAAYINPTIEAVISSATCEVAGIAFTSRVCPRIVSSPSGQPVPPPRWILTLIRQPERLRCSPWRTARQTWYRSVTVMQARPTSKIKQSVPGWSAPTCWEIWSGVTTTATVCLMP